MAAADITVNLATDLPQLAEECVVLTATSAETYTTKMSSPQFAVASYMEAVAATPLSIGISGRTVTVTCSGVVDKKVAVLIKGYK